ncbi:hypothetical protein PTTG_29818 [Puccinia triticina 1-1 BBBD Race 1]|uniref:CxC1 domain-containing protein n=1 Tax=Puccinia triticina (isolate 1-1 / race 1 (BBBD)) TaxID=630390 RepID=A0A180G1T0_PUCT1|nr:hypothetical protein PTTG_29818 [Puccinia triticina 1-1 BBBD Race 1]
MTRRTKIKNPREPRSQRLRRSQNAALNASAWSRLRRREIIASQEAERIENSETMQIPYDPNDESQRQDEDPESEDEEEDTTSRWLTYAEEEEQEEGIDPSIHSIQEEYRRRAREFNWSCLMKQLHTWYLTLKLHTKNWSGTNAYEEYKSDACKCTAQQKTTRPIDMVDIYAQRRRPVEFCKCTYDAVRLLRLGYLAGSPLKPQTAFSLPLLIFHNSLWNNCNIGMLPFTVALTEFLEPRSERLCVKGKKHARDMRKPFSAAVDLFRSLERRTDDLMDEALNLTEQDKLANQSCPACFGPKPSNDADYPASTRNRLVVCLDGNFQHRHHAKASRDSETLCMPNIFLPEGSVEKMTEEIRHMELVNKPPAQADRCADAHKAADDKRNESTWKGCDDTGLMGCCCRHDAAISLANIYKSGELRALPLALLKKLLGVDPDRPVGILYDIGCSLDKYIKLRGLLPDLIKGATFGTSIFHSYVHNWTCQLDYNPRLNKGWGLSDGEGLERMWSYLSTLRDKKTPKFKLASIRRREIRKELEKILLLDNPFKAGRKYTVSYFRKQWKHQRTFRADHTDEEQERRDKLVKIYEHRANLELLRQVFPQTPNSRLTANQNQCRERLTDPDLDLLSDAEVKKISDKIEKVSRKLNKDAAEAEALGIDLPSGEENSDEQRLLLLLWNSKNELYTQAVQLRAERQPLLDAKKLGTCVGTELKEKILKAMGNRRPAVKRLLDKYNKLFAEYLQKFPNQQSTDSSHYPLDYNTFSSWPLDHQFWNDGLYFQSKAPWAIEPNVRAGINCVLILDRVQEEFELISQELARAVGWAISYYTHVENVITEMGERITLLGNQPENVDVDRFDRLVLHGLDQRDRLRVIRKELRCRQTLHAALVEEWHSHVPWLANHCQPSEYRTSMLRNWDNMRTKMGLAEYASSSNLPEVDVELEKAILEVGADDGEDAEEDMFFNTDAEDDVTDDD